MPLYDFACRRCGERFTLLTSWQKKKEACCPQCGSRDVAEILGSFNTLGCGGTGFT